ncbi:DUF1704 domain-containing protein [Candidatus Peregrinibacteria bacterium]|nr:DUF1704 domain-containing protein [Candidatus Peregrinibacteria bacterium]
MLKKIFGHHGILGINARNLLYLRPYNPKKAIKLADDKIKTKQFLAAREIPVPKLFNIIKNPEELEKFNFESLPNSFVLKPNNGYGGEGIIPIVDKKDGYFITSSGKKLNKYDLKEHINDILDGRFSISNVGDIAFFEQLVVADERIGKFSYKGLPDIRVVVHNLIPVMAMLRLPTKESDGKANLHLGAVGVGIDISNGKATHITYKNRIIDELPDNKGKIKGEKIPYWDEILTIASKAQLITNLGYLAADICIDKNTGPVVLELNARAGLGVQIANLAPLRKRLERIEGVKVTKPVKGVRIAKDMFGNVVEKEIKEISGKEVITADEKVELINKKGTIQVKTKIDTGRERSVIDEEFASKNNLLEDENYDDEQATVKIKFNIKGRRKQTIADLEKFSNKDYKIILGRRDLKDFLIDTSIQEKNDIKIKKKKKNSVKTGTPTNFYKIDNMLSNVDNKIKLLYHLRPLNLESEKKKFFKNKNYNPNLEYPALKFNPMDLIDALNKIKPDDSPLGIIYNEKKKEILNKIKLLESINEEDFTKYSIKLFGEPSEKDVSNCIDFIKTIDFKNIKKHKKLYNSNDALKAFNKVFDKYDLPNWKVKIKENMVANCVAGKNNRLFVREGAEFDRDRIEALIVHEIETHILTAENGKMQPYEIFKRGTANYLKTQEGLAMYNVEKQRHEPFFKNYKALGHVVAISTSLKGSFSDAYKALRELGIPKEQAFRSALKSKRGYYDTSQPGAFTKDFIYYKGYMEIKKYFDEGGDIKMLYIGKISIDDIEIIKKIRELKEPFILPEWIKK